jgi:hypothetical protein
MALVIPDEETGNELVFFKRRGKWYCFLRDSETKRFIKRMYDIYAYAGGSINYISSDKPLFVDFFAFSKIEIDEKGKFLETLEEEPMILISGIDSYVDRYYGSQLTFYIEPGTKEVATELVKGYGFISELPSDIPEIYGMDSGIFELRKRRREDVREKRLVEKYWW